MFVCLFGWLFVCLFVCLFVSTESVKFDIRVFIWTGEDTWTGFRLFGQEWDKMDRSVLCCTRECVQSYRIVLSWKGVCYVVQESVKLDRSVLSWI